MMILFTGLGNAVVRVKVQVRTANWVGAPADGVFGDDLCVAHMRAALMLVVHLSVAHLVAHRPFGITEYEAGDSCDWLEHVGAKLYLTTHKTM
jgi:hypothetical protein